MGVLAGRIPGKAQERYDEKVFGRLMELVKRFFSYAEGYGPAVAEREVEARLDRPRRTFYF